jgi:uncharacterized protein (TIGR03435 family)
MVITPYDITQGVIMIRERFSGAVLLSAAAAILSAQDTRPQFDVASIKPSAPAPGRMFGSRGPGMFNTENMPVKGIIAEAYGVKQFQISGGPSWIDSDGYTITAKTSGEGAPKERFEKMMLMLQVLLEDRFQLRFHRTTKEMPIYALTVGKSGKLPPADCVKFDEKNRPAPPAPGQPPIRFCGNIRGGRSGPNSTLDASGVTTADFIRWLSNVTGRTIVDKTGFTGTFDAKLEYLPEMAQNVKPIGEGEPPAAVENAAPSLFTALQERLGLKLESERGPVEILVIDRIERPTEN